MKITITNENGRTDGIVPMTISVEELDRMKDGWRRSETQAAKFTQAERGEMIRKFLEAVEEYKLKP